MAGTLHVSWLCSHRQVGQFCWPKEGQFNWPSTLKSHFKANGIDATVLMDGNYALQICVDPNDMMKGVFRISEQLFLRVACEFQSLRWFAEEHSSIFSDVVGDVSPITMGTHGLINESPPGWQGLKCLLDDPA
jgi:hypothetical protein|tara:strand:+ start:174 stop:572 length:399 start_codon:yes stop_codon:yes gene_type:complete